MFNVRSFITLGAASILMVMPLYLKAQANTPQPVTGSTPVPATPTGAVPATATPAPAAPTSAAPAPAAAATPSTPAGPAVAPAATAPAPAAPTGASSAPEADATPSAPAPAAAPAVLASADGEKPGVRIEVTELKRGSGGTVNLKFVLINDSGEEVNVMGYLDLGEYGYSVSAVHLIDPVGKKKYLVIQDTEKKCVCSRDIKDVKAKTRVNLWAKFPAPPAEVQKVSIVVPHFSPLDDVPISQ